MSAFATALLPLAAQTPQQLALPVTAVATSAPPTLTFSWPFDASATSYVVRRRVAGELGWEPPQTVPGGGGATSWVDAAVVAGERYDYWFTKSGGVQARSFLTGGVEAAAIEQRGTVVLLVDASVVAALGGRLDRLVADLVGDGYRVLRHDVPPTDPVASVKAQIVADVAAHPGDVTVFLLGHVPVPYSGAINPDGHPDHLGAWPADVFYGELNGVWTDTSVNTTSATRPQNQNVPGDGKYDQSVIPSDVDLAVGRVDLADMPAFGVPPATLLAQYLDKDHDYRHKVFAVDQRAVIDDNFGWFSGEAFAASGWRNFGALVGPANVIAADYFTTLNTTAGGGYVWSYGCGGGWFSGAGGIGSTSQFVTSTNRGVFTLLFGSYFGDWDSTDNFLKAPLCSGWTLCDAWVGRPHWSFHAMGMGATIGAATRASQNDTLAGGLFTRYVHLALMGDPTLRQHVVAPPANVAVTDLWPMAGVAWTASPDAVAGYHVYRAATPAGPFVRLTAAPVAATVFVDPAPVPGAQTYMVRALRLETTPSGSYWNLSQGAFATATLPQQAASHQNYGAGCYAPPLALSASPAPVSTAGAGTVVTYAIDGVPEAAPGSGVHFGVVVVSLTPDLPGTSLAGIGAAGCDLYVGSLDVTIAFTSASSSAAAAFALPAGVPGGAQFWAQAAALFVPGSLPNGQNAFGAVTSNGVASFVNDH